MKKVVFVTALLIYFPIFSQVKFSSNLPSFMNVNTSVDFDVKIEKGSMNGFAKYQIDLPVGYVITPIDVKEGNFTFENQRAKIVWVSLPSEPEELLIKLTVTAASHATNPGNINQKLFYLDNGEKKELETSITTTLNLALTVSEPLETKQETEPISASNQELVKPPVAESIEETVKSEIVIKETEPVEVKSELAAIENKPTEKIKSENLTSAKVVNNSETGIIFKVQIGAFNSQPKKTAFPFDVSINMIDGLYRVTTGSFQTKDDAIKYRNELTEKGYSGFIIRFKKGQRIN